MSKLYEKLFRPALFKLDAETAHELGIEALKLGASSMFAANRDENLAKIERFGLMFANPLGIAAGFDKNGVVVGQLAGLGFGFVEVGTVTLKPQPGNEKPRLFRLPEDNALINRLGFNNQGAKSIAERLKKISRKCVVGVNIGKNKNVPNEEAVENYLQCFDIVRGVADYVSINISSPNTPNLRELQRTENLEDLLAAMQQKNEQPTEGGTKNAKPLLVKIAPDLSEEEIEAMTDACIRSNVAGIIATNTTIDRSGLRTPDVDKFGSGGLSGKPLSKRSTEIISKIYRHSNGKLPIVGVGGIFNAADAFEKIAAGASLLQAYTGFIYGGPSFAGDVNDGLAKILRERDFANLDEAVGSAVK